MKLRQEQGEAGTLDVRGDGRGPRRAPPRRERGPGGRPTLASRFGEQPVLNSLLLLACIALIIVAYTAIGPASQSSGQTTRTTTVKNGVVQSTVSGSGNVQSADQLNLGFKTSGTVTHIYVKAGQHVTQGQLLATLDPKSSEVTLEQAKATLQSAEANLAKAEENEAEASSGQGSSGAGATAAAASTSTIAYTANAAASASTSTPATSTTPTTGARTPASRSPTSTSRTTTTAPSTTSRKTGPSTSPGANSTAGASTHATPAKESNSAVAPASSTNSSSSSNKQSVATREANLASARAAVKSDKLTVQSAEQAVQNTKLYAPTSGTIVALSGEVGETVSGTGTTRSASGASGSSNGGSSSSGSPTGSGGGKSSAGASSSAAGSSSSGQGSSTSSSAFAVVSNLESLQLVVALSESEIGSVHEGQIATVTIEALGGRKVAAHVVSVSQVPTSSSGAVSYDVTFQLDQGAEDLKVGMSATAEVVVKQAEGLNVPTSAIRAGSVTVVRSGKHVTQPVTTGLAGNSSTIILSGLKAGEEVVLPSATTTGSASSPGARGALRTGARGGLGGGLGGGGFVGGGFAGGPPGG